MIRAFTLIELIIGLIISSIVVIMAGVVFNISIKQFGEYKKANEKLKDLATLEFLMQNDIDHSTSLRYVAENKIRVVYPNYAVLYEWFPDRVLRAMQNNTDTFKIVNEKVELSFNGSIQLVGEKIVDKISFRLKYDDIAYLVCFRKQYSSNILMSEKIKN